MVRCLLSLGRMLSYAAAAFLLCGCTAMVLREHVVEGTYQPTNIYRKQAVLPSQIRRVAVLPIAVVGSESVLEAGADALQPVLNSELAKSKRFELTLISPEQLRDWTGQGAWRSDEQLPEGFLERLGNATGCDAVLFCQLTRYQPYQPVAVGWKLSLVENKHGTICWSADELLDSGDPSVANSARLYASQNIQDQPSLFASPVILNSPSRFGQYSVSALLATLPEREKR